MKRELIAYTLGICFMLSGAFFFQPYIAAAFAPAESVKPIVVLDAGHGGEDGGAIAAAGIKESDINLEIVLKIECLMGFLGIETVLVRRDDVSIYDSGCKTLREKKVSDLNNRVKLINSLPNAHLISVHQNTFTDPRYKGAQVFFGKGELSAQWGEKTQMLLCALDPENTRRAGFVPEHVYLFQHIACPSILVECGFLSNGEETALLLTPAYQRKISLLLTCAYIQQQQETAKPLGVEED